MMVLDDPTLMDEVSRLITQQRYPAEYAFQQVAEKFVRTLAAIKLAMVHGELDDPHAALAHGRAWFSDRSVVASLMGGGHSCVITDFQLRPTGFERMLVIADAGKKVRMLGAFPLPVEVVQFAPKATAGVIRALAAEVGCKGEVRLRNGVDGKPFVSENGNFILDCAFGRIARPQDLAEALSIIPGVVEHGLFIGLCDEALIAGPSGVERLTVDFDDDENGEEDAS